jgi:glucosylceramidase
MRWCRPDLQEGFCEAIGDFVPGFQASVKNYQTMDGFGFALTGGSADLISKLPQGQRDDLLQELFSTAGSGIGLTYLRIGVGASDLSRVSYSYNDLLPGETDPNLERFNLAAGDIQIVPC